MAPSELSQIQQHLKMRPLTALATAVRQFIQHGQDERAFKEEFDQNISFYEDDPRKPPKELEGSGRSSGWWRPHPLDLHPPNTPESEARLERVLKGEEKLDGHTFNVPPASRTYFEAQLKEVAQTLRLDHCYCLYLARQTQSEESRIWIRSKVQPHVGSGVGGSDTIGGVHGFAGEAEIDFRINHLAAMRYLWFIERRSAMQALLDLVQANLTAGEVCESKLHVIKEATDRFVRQGMPFILMSRIKAITALNMNGRTDLELELEVERQKAAECLYFLYYQTPIPASVLLSTGDSPAQPQGGAASGLGQLSNAGRPSATSQQITLTSLLHDMAAALKDPNRLSRSTGGPNASQTGPGGLRPALTSGFGGAQSQALHLAQQQQQAAGALVVGSGAVTGARHHEDNMLFKALVTIAMAVVNALILPDECQPSDKDRKAMPTDRLGLKAWLLQAAAKHAAITQELNRLRQSGSGPVPQEAELRNRLQAAATEAKRRLDAFKSQLVLAEEKDEEGGGGRVLQARDAFEALVALGVGAFLRDAPLDKALHKAAGFESARYKRQLLDCACAKRVFSFIEGALVTTWTGQAASEVINQFYMDEIVELLGHYLKHDYAATLAAPIRKPPTPYGQQGELNYDVAYSTISLVKRLCEVDISVTAPHALAGPNTSCSYGGAWDMTDPTSPPDLWLAGRLLWNKGDGGAWTPVIFVNEVFRQVKAHWREDERLQLMWVDLLVAMASCPAPNLKIETVEYLIANTPYSTDLFYYVLDGAMRASADALWPYERLLLAVLVLAERVTCHALATYAHIDYVTHLLPRLYSLASCVLSDEVKGQLFRALAAFARLPKYARVIWEHLEESNILPAIKRELEQEKASNLRFPISEGFAILMVDLIRGDIPYDLGEAMGTRMVGYNATFAAIRASSPGIQPYVDHLLVDIRKAVEHVMHEHQPGGHAALPPDVTQHYWRIMAKSLEAMVLILQRYPIAEGDEDRMRNLGLDHIQRRVAREQVQRDQYVASSERAPSVGFNLLKRLLAERDAHSLLPFVRAILSQSEGQQPAFMYQFQAQAQALTMGGGAHDSGPYGAGCILLERKNRDREAKALAEAVQMLDALEMGDDKDLKRTRAAVEELAWREHAVKLALELLNLVFVKDRHFVDMAKASLQIVEERDEDSMMETDLPAELDPQALPKELRERLPLPELLPMVIQYSAYDFHPALRLQSALLLREWLQRCPRPEEVRQVFVLPTLGENVAARSRDSILKNVLATGTPVEDHALEFATLAQALNLLTKFDPDERQVERLVHFLTLDTLLHNLKPLMWTISHELLGFTSPDRLSAAPLGGAFHGDDRVLPLDTGVMFTFKTIVENLSSVPAFLSDAPLLAEKSMELVFRLCASRRSKRATLAFLQSPPIDFFHRLLPAMRVHRPPPREAPRLSRRLDARTLRQHVDYSSLLHLWSWLLKASAIALFQQSAAVRQAEGDSATITNSGMDYAKPATLFNLLFLNDQRMLPHSGGDAPMDGFNSTLITDVLANLDLARDQKAPLGDRPPSPPAMIEELIKEYRHLCIQALPGPEENTPYYVLDGDSLMTVLRQRLFSQLQQQGGGGGGNSGLEDRLAHEAQQYTLQWNHFMLRLAGESHLCQSWRYVVETALLSCGDMVVDERRPEDERLQLVLTLLDCAVRKSCRCLHAEATVLRHLSAVALFTCQTLFDYASARPGIPLAVLDESQGQMALSLLLQGLLRMGDHDEHTPSSSLVFRAHMYTAIVLFLRASTLKTLPTLVAASTNGDMDGGAVVIAEPTGEELLRMRQRANAQVLADDRYLPGLIHALVSDCASEQYEGPAVSDMVVRRRWQALACSLLGLVFETIRTEVDEHGKPRHPRALAEVLGCLPQLLKDVEYHFCVDVPGDDLPMLRGLEDEETERRRTGETYVFKYYMTMLAQLAQVQEGAASLVKHNMVRILDNARTFRVKRKALMSSMRIDDHDGDEEGGEPLESQVGVALRLLETLLAQLRTSRPLRDEAMAFLTHHEAVLSEYMRDRQLTLEGMEEVGVMVSVLAHTMDKDVVRDSSAVYPLLVYDMFEIYSTDLLPPFALDVLRGTTQTSWWKQVQCDEDRNVQCEPPRGARDNLMWRVVDSLKLLASQNLLLRVTTYMRKRLEAGITYDCIKWERVIEAIRSVIDLYQKQGVGPARPIPPVSEARRYCHVSTVRQGQTVVLRGGSSKQLVWNYDYLRFSLWHILGQLLHILYHVIKYQEACRPQRFKAVKQQIKVRFIDAVGGNRGIELTRPSFSSSGETDPFHQEVRDRITDLLGS